MNKKRRKAIRTFLIKDYDIVVKTQIFLTDINDFSKVSSIRNKYFANSNPVSTLVEFISLVKKGVKLI